MKILALLLLSLSGVNAMAADQCEGLNPVVFHTAGPRFNEFQMPDIRAHGGYWGSQGKLVVMGGPFPGKAIGMMVLAEGVTYAQAEELAANDPAIKAGFLLAEVKCWDVKIDNSKQ
ncbi:MAG: YciI family protein [Bdellovibrionota bacterium]